MTISSAAALLAAITLASPAAADIGARARVSARLAPAASFVAGKPVVVNCGDTGEAAIGLTVPGADSILLDATGCVELERWLKGKRVPIARLAIDIHSLIHESLHARGWTSEGHVDCSAFRRLRLIASRFFGIREYVRLNTLVSEASAWRAAFPASYRTEC